MWTGLHIGEELVGLKIEPTEGSKSTKISVGAFLATLPDQSTKSNIRRVLEEKLAVDEDLTEFYSFAKKDPILKHAAEDLRGMHDTLRGSLFDSATIAVCLQLARLNRSEQMMRSLVSNYGEDAEFDGRIVRVRPTPIMISKVSVEELKGRCNLGYRAKYIVQLATTLNGGFPTLEELARMPPEESKAKLMELPGVGDYSADIINPRNGFPIDAWSVDVFGKLLFGKEPSDKRAAVDKVKREGIRRWGKWSWMAFFYVVQDLRNISKKLGVELRLQ